MSIHEPPARHRGVMYATIAAIAALASPAAAGTIVYDSFDKPGGYTLSDYGAKWVNPYGLGEMAGNDTRNFAGGQFNIAATPFTTGYDFSVYDHLKYLGVSTQSFAVADKTSVTFSSTIRAATPGTDPGRVIEGTYSDGTKYAEKTLEGQQAAAVMNMIDFESGQLFDWFISGTQAFTLVERLPSAVTNPSLMPGDPGYVGIDLAYTQIINVVDIGAGPHDVAITYSDEGANASAYYYLDGKLISTVNNVGIPLDKQGVPFTGVYPSYGPGELLGDKIHNLVIGHGLFSLLDAFPFQLPERPDLAVSIPVENRIFGQGVDASFDDFKVKTFTTRPGFGAVPEPTTWALALMGFGLVGGALRRRRTQAA